MTLFLEFAVSMLAAFGLSSLIWLIVGWLLLPGACPAQVVVTGRDGGEELEQTVRGLLWLRGSGLWRGVMIIEDAGLNEQGLALAQALAGQEGVELRTARPGA